MEYYKIKMNKVRTATLAKLLNCRKVFAKCILKKMHEFTNADAEIFIRADGEPFSVTFVLTENENSMAKYEFKYGKFQTSPKEYSARYVREGVLRKELKQSKDDLRIKEYASDGRVISRVSDNGDTLSVYQWGEDNILKQRLTFMGGFLHHVATYEYDAQKQEYSSKVYGYDNALLKTKEKIPKAHFYSHNT